MTSQSPRIYTYKITFEEVPYYYYGMHEEKVYDEEYWGSPVTNKWCWKLYTPKKQILEVFDTREDAYEIEKRLIKPVYKSDKWCLNENCVGSFSLETCSKAGKIGGSISGKINKERGIGIFGRTSEQKREDGRKGGIENVRSGHIQRLGKETSKKHMENKTGIFGFDEKRKSEVGRKGGKMSYKHGTGAFALTPEERKKVSKKANETNKKNKTGIYSITQEQKREIGKKANETNKKNKTGIYSLTPNQISETTRKTNFQKWQCTVTGFITNAGNLSQYQKARGIDKSMRVRVE